MRCALERLNFVPARKKILFFCCFALVNFSSYTELRLFACYLKIKTAISAMKSLKKVRGKKVSQQHCRTNKSTFAWYEGESDSPSVQQNKL